MTKGYNNIEEFVEGSDPRSGVVALMISSDGQIVKPYLYRDNALYEQVLRFNWNWKPEDDNSKAFEVVDEVKMFDVEGLPDPKVLYSFGENWTLAFYGNLPDDLQNKIFFLPVYVPTVEE